MTSAEFPLPGGYFVIYRPLITHAGLGLFSWLGLHSQGLVHGGITHAEPCSCLILHMQGLVPGKNCTCRVL
jgi:hypothetical protein